MTLAQRIAYAVLFLSLARFTVPGIAAAVAEAIDLWPLKVEERRAKMFGPFYESVKRIDAAVPDEERLPVLVGRDPGPALFANYYLYPQRTRFYPGFLYLRPERGKFRKLVRIEGEAELLTYEEARAAEMGRSHVAPHLDVPAESATTFVVPVAASGDGRPPDVWTTEAVIVNSSAETAALKFRLEPSNREAAVRLEPGEKRSWNDLVYQLFGVLDSGWVHIESDRPVRARFWFANRALREADPVPLARFAKSFSFPHHPGSRIWLLNPHDRKISIRLNGGEHSLDPHNLVAIEWPHPLRVESEDELFVYQSWRDGADATHFRWPEPS
jgi:hypothetical protein